MKQSGARVSRRIVLAVLGVSPLAHAQTASGLESDPAAFLCRQFAENHERTAALSNRWCDLESFLIEHHAWFKLTTSEQNALPDAQQLFAIDSELETLAKEQALILRRLHRTPAATIQGAMGKLAVLAEEIEPDDHPSAHRMLLSVIADFQVLLKDYG